MLQTIGHGDAYYSGLLGLPGPPNRYSQPHIILCISQSNKSLSKSFKKKGTQRIKVNICLHISLLGYNQRGKKKEQSISYRLLVLIFIVFQHEIANPTFSFHNCVVLPRKYLQCINEKVGSFYLSKVSPIIVTIMVGLVVLIVSPRESNFGRGWERMTTLFAK